MAAALSAYQHIEIKKSLFSTKAIYTPTQSQAKAVILEYTPTEGERVARAPQKSRSYEKSQLLFLFGLIILGYLFTFLLRLRSYNIVTFRVKMASIIKSITYDYFTPDFIHKPRKK